MGPYGWDGGGWGWAGWVFMGLMMVVFWTVVVAAVVVFVRYSGRDHGAPPPGTEDAAMRILDERLARGEIDADEYTRRRDLLRAR